MQLVFRVWCFVFGVSFLVLDNAYQTLSWKHQTLFPYLFNELIRIVGSIEIEHRPLVQRHTGLPTEEFAGILF
jgi:hypothetical protein